MENKIPCFHGNLFSMEMGFHLEGEVKETMPIIGVQMAF